MPSKLGNAQVQQGEWSGPAGDDHTFEATGRKARLRFSVPVSALVRSGAWDDSLVDLYTRAAAGERITGRAEILDLMDAVVCAMFITPVIAVPDDKGKVPPGATSIDDLDQTEIDYAIQAAFGGAAMASFPGDGTGDDPRTDGPEVPDAAERDAGS
jgi:hypothetical protein